MSVTEEVSRREDCTKTSVTLGGAWSSSTEKTQVSKGNAGESKSNW